MKMTTLAERHFRFRFRHDRPARRLCIPCLSRGDIEGGRGSGMWSGWMVTSVQRLCFPHVQHFGLTSGDARPRTATLQQEMGGDHSGQSSQLSVIVQPAEPDRPGVIPACSMQPASRPEASWPCSLQARCIHVTPHRIARLECLYPRLVSSSYHSLYPLPTASLAWIGARLPGCELSPKHGDIREPGMAEWLLH